MLQLVLVASKLLSTAPASGLQHDWRLAVDGLDPFFVSSQTRQWHKIISHLKGGSCLGPMVVPVGRVALEDVALASIRSHRRFGCAPLPGRSGRSNCKNGSFTSVGFSPAKIVVQQKWLANLEKWWMTTAWPGRDCKMSWYNIDIILFPRLEQPGNGNPLRTL